MSVHWSAWVWDKSTYKDSQLLIHLALADISHHDGRFFASQVQIATMARCSVEYVRRTIKDMESKGWVQIIAKGNSKGKATIYQLIRIDEQTQLPNSVGGLDLDQLPNYVGDNSPTTKASLPNSTPKHSSFTPILNTTDAIAKAIAQKWWDSQESKPIGKRAWWSLNEVVKACLSQNYQETQILLALEKIKTVPTMRQMDMALKSVEGVSAELKRSRATLEADRKATEAILRDLDSVDRVAMPDSAKSILKASGLLR